MKVSAAIDSEVAEDGDPSAMLSSANALFVCTVARATPANPISVSRRVDFAAFVKSVLNGTTGFESPLLAFAMGFDRKLVADILLIRDVVELDVRGHRGAPHCTLTELDNMHAVTLVDQRSCRGVTRGSVPPRAVIAKRSRRQAGTDKKNDDDDEIKTSSRVPSNPLQSLHALAAS